MVVRRPGLAGDTNSAVLFGFGRRTVGSADVRRQFGDRSTKLTSYFNVGEAVAANELGMTVDEGGRQREGDEEDEGDSGQSAVGNRPAFAVFDGVLGTMPAGMEEAMLESPIFCEIVPAGVFQFPSVMTEAADRLRRKRLPIERGHPKPFMIGGFRLELSLAVVILGDRFFGADHADGALIVGRER